MAEPVAPAILDGASGKLLHVWNALCSDRTGLLEPVTCPASDAGTWGRAGAVIDPATGDIFIATGNADWNGKTDRGDATWLFVADHRGTAAWQLVAGRLVERWDNRTGGTSPFEADGLLYVDAREGGLHVYRATTGKPVATLVCGRGHWNSPIVVDGRVILPEGDANRHATRGVLDIWSLPQPAAATAAHHGP